MKASVLLIACNEAANLPRCLGSLEWCDDIVLVDSGSTDATVDIAEAAGARVLRRPFDNFAAQRNFGLEQGGFRHDWVLHLDADEVLTEEFVTALQALDPPEGVDAYMVPSKMMLFGRWLRHAAKWPVYQVRLGHVRRLRFRQVGHGQQEDVPPERVSTFPEPYLHYSFSHGMRRWLEKHVRYAADEAEYVLARRQEGAPVATAGDGAAHRRRRAKARAARIPLVLRPAARFVHVYVLGRGFLDGRAGLVYALMLSVYEGMIALFAYEKTLSRRSASN